MRVQSVESVDGFGFCARADTAEYVAQKILKGIEDEEAEIFAHDWMKRGVNANP